VPTARSCYPPAMEPLRTTTFILTRADALAYEQASARFSPLGILALILWLGLCGSLAFVIPRDFAGPLLGWSFSVLVSLLLAIGYVLALVLIAARQYVAARRRLRHPLEITVAEWPERLEIIGTDLPRDLPLIDIRESIPTRTHLFLVSDDGVLILPRTAFAEDGAIDDLAARIAGRPVGPKVDAAVPAS
jgi:hypothetical protein